MHTHAHTHAYVVPRYRVALPVAGMAEACVPPVMLHVLPGVTRVPIFPRGRLVAGSDIKTCSTVTVGLDCKYRLTFYATERDKRKHVRVKRTHRQLVAATGASSVMFASTKKQAAVKPKLVRQSTDLLEGASPRRIRELSPKQRSQQRTAALAKLAEVQKELQKAAQAALAVYAAANEREQAPMPKKTKAERQLYQVLHITKSNHIRARSHSLYAK